MPRSPERAQFERNGVSFTRMQIAQVTRARVSEHGLPGFGASLSTVNGHRDRAGLIPQDRENDANQFA
jgi:hypothetical protein